MGPRGRWWAAGIAVLAAATLAVVLLVRPDDGPGEGGRAPGTASWSGLVQPFLAADDVGGQVLVAHRTAPADAGPGVRGRVEAARLAPDSTRWTAPERLSSQGSSVGLSADAAGRGRAIVAWTSGGHVFTRSLGAGGSWSPEQQLSDATGTRWVRVEVNRAGDEMAVWRQAGRVALAWRAANGEWQRWLGPPTDHRPTAALGERSAGDAVARVVWLEGAGAGTTVRLRAVRFGATSAQDERTLLRRPYLRTFGWDAGPDRQTLTVMFRTPDADPGTDATTSTVATYDGLFGAPLRLRWAQPNGSPQATPVVAMTGGAARVSWAGYRLSADRLDSYGDLWTRAGLDGVWSAGERVAGTRPNAAVVAIGQEVDASGRGLVTFRADDGSGPDTATVLGVPDLSRRLLEGTPVLAALAPVATGVGLYGPLALAWTTGTEAAPRVRVRVVPR